MAGLSGLLSELGLPVTMLSLLLAHAEAVARDADRLGLVSVADADNVLSRHTADSLLFALVRRPEAGERWVDVGSGAGFPGFVLACCYPAASFTLLEPQRRRAGFLDVQAARLGLENVRTIAARAQDVTETFDVAVARALADPAIALQTLRRLVPNGDAIVAVGAEAVAPASVQEFLLPRDGVDSPARLFMMPSTAGGAA